MTPSSVTVAYWDAVARRYLDLFRGEFAGKPFDQKVLRDFAGRFAPGAEILDAGCGPCAEVAGILAGYGLDVTGIDISPKCIELARVEQPSLRFEVMDMADMAFGEGSFDGVVAYYALHYMPMAALAGVMCEFARVLRPKGRLLLVAKEGTGEGWIDDPLGVADKVFWSAPDLAGLEQVVTENGFAIVERDIRRPLAQEIDVRRIYLVAERA